MKKCKSLLSFKIFICLLMFTMPIGCATKSDDPPPPTPSVDVTPNFPSGPTPDPTPNPTPSPTPGPAPDPTSNSLTGYKTVKHPNGVFQVDVPRNWADIEFGSVSAQGTFIGYSLEASPDLGCPNYKCLKIYINESTDCCFSGL